MAREATTSPAGRDWIRHCLLQEARDNSETLREARGGPFGSSGAVASRAAVRARPQFTVPLHGGNFHVHFLL